VDARVAGETAAGRRVHGQLHSRSVTTRSRIADHELVVCIILPHFVILAFTNQRKSLKNCEHFFIFCGSLQKHALANRSGCAG
jgi:hypothetical protein